MGRQLLACAAGALQLHCCVAILAGGCRSRRNRWNDKATRRTRTRKLAYRDTMCSPISCVGTWYVIHSVKHMTQLRLGISRQLGKTSLERTRIVLIFKLSCICSCSMRMLAIQNCACIQGHCCSAAGLAQQTGRRPEEAAAMVIAAVTSAGLQASCGQ